MKNWLITVYLDAGSFNLEATTEAAARIAFSLLMNSQFTSSPGTPKIVRQTLHYGKPGELKFVSEFPVPGETL